MSMINTKYGMTMNDDKPEDYYILKKDCSFSCEVENMNLDALRKIFEVPPGNMASIKWSAHVLTQKRLHKKKRIAKKWAKQGKYKTVLVAHTAAVKALTAEEKGEFTNYKVELDHE